MSLSAPSPDSFEASRAKVRSAEQEQRLGAALASHFSTVWRALRRFGVHERNADDAAQHVFMHFAARLEIVELGRERPYLLGIAAKVAAENPDLYFEIQQLNDYGSESLSALLYAVERLRTAVRAGDAAGFRALMERGRAYLETRR
jgi:prephenate dehydrogenase